MTINKETSSHPANPTPADGAPASAVLPTGAIDKLAPFRVLFGMPVAVQFAIQVPYVQIAIMMDKSGRAQTAQVPGTGQLIGLPAVAEGVPPTSVAVGVLRGSECGTWLVIEEQMGIPRSGETPEGRAFMDVYVRPDMITHVSFVKAVEFAARRSLIE